MRKFFTCIMALWAFCSCSKVWEEDIRPDAAPDGTPFTMEIGFGFSEPLQVNVSTKAESSEAAEAKVQDLYVFIFDGSGAKKYGRYFGYDMRRTSLTTLDDTDFEGWYIENKTMTGVTPAVSQTRGAVKISTQKVSDAKVVVLANVSEPVLSFGDGSDDIGYLEGIQTYDELSKTVVYMDKHVLNRKDQFLMTGELEVSNTMTMTWGEGATMEDRNESYKVQLKAVDAKVKFLVKANPANISEVKAVQWQGCRLPDRCYLLAPTDSELEKDILFFDSEYNYFEGLETIDGSDWYVFTFYMLQNSQERETGKSAATSYHERELQRKIDTSKPFERSGGGYYQDNGDWVHAPNQASYVKFDLVLTLTNDGITSMQNAALDDHISVNIVQGLTSDAVFTVHLGDFGSSTESNVSRFDNYETLRSHFYTYKITVNNAYSILAEVENDTENQPGYEGFILLTTNEIVNADAHYEYHSIRFPYNEAVVENPTMFSWYVKTPFGEGEPLIKQEKDAEGNVTRVYYDGDTPELDYKWVKFVVNEVEGDRYKTVRRNYPGDSKYNPAWKPSDGDPDPDQLLDISQLVEFISSQSKKKHDGAENHHFINDEILVTAFINEYYYEEHPITGDVDPNLWRQFINAKPREMHILSDARQSRDRRSDLILSSHSIVQQSIQSIYNVYAPGLRTLWGCEHIDEMKKEAPLGWTYWPAGCPESERSGSSDETGKNNGRLNTAYIWGISSGGTHQEGRLWNTYLDYNVDNNTPELKEAYHGMAWSCMTRNRDNNGNGTIDPEEVRWYLAAANQLAGMWLGNESLSYSARLYQPAEDQWRAHVMSSTNKQVFWAEEGAAFGAYANDANKTGEYHTWATLEEAAKGQSVRCLRNVGTYDDGGDVKDISYAPYSTDVQQFYTIDNHGYAPTDPDAWYTINFERLNTMSIREYTDTDLPFHDQQNLLNRVYLQLETQPRSNVVVYSPTVAAKDINNTVDSDMHNKYCPPGYRFPNQSEALIMALGLPGEYIKNNADGTAANGFSPTRTYYDRGYYGRLKDSWSEWVAQTGKEKSDSWAVESDKVIWAISHSSANVKLHESTKLFVDSRCVRDRDQTGEIFGDLSLDGLYLYAGDTHPITMNFSSSASPLTNISLAMFYTAGDGSSRSQSIPVNQQPSGLQYRYTQDLEVPSLPELGLKLSDLPQDVIIQAIVRNMAGNTQYFDLHLTLVHPLQDVSMKFPEQYDTDKGYPIELYATLGGHTLSFDSTAPLVLEWKAGDGMPWNSYTVDASHTSSGSYTRGKNKATVYLKDFLDSVPADLTGTTYSYRLVAKTSDGMTMASPVKSVQMLKHNFCANPEPAGGWTSSHHLNDISTMWRIEAGGLDFNAGDRLEVMMDLTPCYYVYTGGDDGGLGKDNILAIGKTAIGAKPKEVISDAVLFYYPMTEKPVANPAEQGLNRLRIHAGNWSSGTEINPLSGTTIPSLAVSLDKDGMYLDGERFTGTPGNWTLVKTGLLSSSRLIVGSEEGKHQSRAIYRYIRVVRDGDRTGFGDEGPVDGGRL